MDTKVQARVIRLFLVIAIFNCCLRSIGQNSLWKPQASASKDLRSGPGGNGLRPSDSTKFVWTSTKKQFVRDRIASDDKGHTWYVRIGQQEMAEVASEHLLWGLGYMAEPLYFIGDLRIGNSHYKNVSLRLRNRTDELERRWKWDKNPFIGSKELQGLAVFISLLASSNNGEHVSVVARDRTTGERKYEIWTFGNSFSARHSDRGASRFYSEVWSPRLSNGVIKLPHDRTGISVAPASAEWMVRQFSSLTDRQLADAFEGAGFSVSDAELYSRSLRKRMDFLAKILSA
jgi:hypothetical protein